MKKFAFPLDRALNWRRLQSERERAELEKLAGEGQAIAGREKRMRSERAEQEHGLAHGLYLDSAYVATLPRWQQQVKQSLAEIAAEQRAADARVAAQREKFQETERAVRLLERLRERRLANWEMELAKEEETFAAEAYLARCIRLRRSETSADK
jgi:septal ring factor EnvC (AmiA/AmiB activator)